MSNSIEEGLREATQDVLVPTCTKTRVLSIVAERRKGKPYKTIAHKMGISVGAVNRYERVFRMYGLEAFADG